MMRFSENILIALCVTIIAPLAVVMAVTVGMSALTLYIAVIIGEGMSTIIQERLCEKNGTGPTEN